MPIYRKRTGGEGGGGATVHNDLTGRSATGSHPITAITDLQTTLDGKASSSHGHAISDVTNLQTTLDGKASSSHGHAISDVTGLQTALDGKADSSHSHATGDVTNLAEFVRDTIATALVAGSNVTITPNDGAETITIDADPGGASDHGALTGLSDDDHTQYHTDARGDARYSQLGHSHGTSDVTNLAEFVRDTIGTALVAGTNVTITPNDGADTITIDATPGSGSTNLTASRTSTSVTVNSDTGTDATIAAADTTDAGVMSAADKSKLDGIATGATANATDADLRDRSTHTGAQAISTVTGLQTALDAKAADSAVVHNTGTETIDGAKTFSTRPIVGTAASSTSDTGAASTAFVMSEIAAAVAGLLDLKSSTDASSNPNYPAASKGDTYIISVAGRIGGASGKVVDVGDTVIASADNAGGTEASVGTSWFVLEHNLAGALLSTNNLSDVASAATARSNIGAQASDATLTALAALTIVANSLTIGTGTDAFAQTSFAANTFPARASTGNLEAKPISDAALSVLDDTTVSAMVDTLGGAASTGTGGLVRSTSPTLTTPVMSGITTRDGAEVWTASAMGALAIDVTKVLNTKSISADSTFTFSGTPATANTVFGMHVTNTDSAPHILTFPSSFSQVTQAARTTCPIAAGGQLFFVWRYDGSAYKVFGDSGYFNKFDATSAPTANEDIADGYGPGSLFLDATGNALYVCESNGAGAAVWHNLSATGGVSDGDKGDITVSASGATWTIDNDAVTYAKMQNVSATSRILGRKTAAAGDTEECTLSEVLDFIGSAAQGDILYRDSSAWARLGAGTANQVLKTGGAGANPAWGAGTAGKHMIPIMAAGMTPSASGGCAPLATVASGANQPDIVSLDFDPTTQEYAQFAVPMPKKWNESTVTYQVIWSHASTSTDFGAVFTLQALAVSDDDAIAQNYGTAVSVTDTGGTTNDIYVSPESSAITIAGTPAENDVVFFRLSRDATNGSDNLAVDARVHGIRLFITTNADTDD